MRPRRFPLPVFLLAIFLVICVFFCTIYFLPKSYLPQGRPDLQLFYRGFGFSQQPGFFGRIYERAVIDDGLAGTTHVRFSQSGFSDFESFYAEGRLRVSGKCRVEFYDLTACPYPSTGVVRSATYYSPTGKIASTVDEKGTGVLTSFEPDSK